MLCAFPLLINLASNSTLASLSRGSSTVPLEVPEVAVIGLAAGRQGSLGTQPSEAALSLCDTEWLTAVLRCLEVTGRGLSQACRLAEPARTGSWPQI